MGNIDGPGGGPGGDPKGDCCERTKDKKKKQKEEKSAWGQSGIIKEHQSIIQQVATDLKVVMYFRRTKKECEDWIRDKHHPKPHSVLSGTTTTGDNVAAVQAWLDRFFQKMDPKKAEAYPKFHSARAGTSQFYTRNARDYIGVVQDGGKPLPGWGKYRWKWITGDYDLFQVVKSDQTCTPVCEKGEDFARLKKEINGQLKWDAIQHGPQVQWCPTPEELPGLPTFKMPELVKEGLKNGTNPKVQISNGTPPRFMNAIDKPLTVVAGSGVVALEKEEEVRDALICQGCAE